MVSFQCDGCQDVVKKPKLDNHSSKCHASFTCIDCSKTFAGPAQWKSHTSCMSEEQKYHKSVYQEPRGRGRGRGRGGARGGQPRPAYSGSGQNMVPLGTQTNGWTAPSPDPVNNSPFNPSEWTATADKTVEITTEPTATTPSNTVAETETKSKKSKKRKSVEVEAAESTPTASIPATTEGPAKKKKKKGESTVEPEPSTPAESKEEKKKKKKARKSEGAEAQAAGTEADVTLAEAAAEPGAPDTSSSKKKSKKSRKSEIVDAVNGDIPTTGTSATIPTPAPTLITSNGDAHPPTDESPSKKKKSRKSEGTTAEPEPVVELATNGVEGKDKADKKQKKEKKHKAGKSNGIVPDEVSVVTDPIPTPALIAPLPSSNGAADDLIPVSIIESTNGKKEKKSKKEKKAKDIVQLDTSAPVEVAAPEIDESPRKRKSKSKTDEAVDGDAPKPKKSKREKKAAEAVAA